MSEELLITTFCIIDDFCASFESEWNNILIEYSENQGVKKPSRKPQMSLSEIMTLAIAFQQSGYRCFKHFYNSFVMSFWKRYFPSLVSYSRFVYLMQRAVFPMFCFVETVLGVCTGISFIDSTLLTVCHIRRANSNKVFKQAAKKGKSTTGWFFGLKLHLVINEMGEIIAYMLTAGNVSDLSPVSYLTRDCFGKLCGDKGYLSKSKFNELYARGLHLITKVRKNMKNKLMPLMDKLLLKKRGLIESVNNLLKSKYQIEHHRHRSKLNFVVNLLSGLAAYQIQDKKPSIYVSEEEKFMLLSA